MKDENEIEDLFKDKFENYEPEVNSKVWKNVKTGAKIAGAGFLGKLLINKIGTTAIIAGVTSIITIIATVTFMNWNAGDKKPVVNNPKTNNEKALHEKATVNEIKEFLKTGEGENKAVENKTPENNNTNSVNVIKPKSIAHIQASATSGIVPFYVDLNNIGKGKKNTWIMGDKKNNQESTMYYFDKPGVYTIKLISIDDKGNKQHDSIYIEVSANSEVPTSFSFSPNGDGKNDNFAVRLENIIKLDATITDKSGNLIYKWNTLDGKWDGTDLNGKPVEQGIYLYTFKIVDGDGEKELKGTVKLKR